MHSCRGWDHLLIPNLFVPYVISPPLSLSLSFSPISCYITMQLVGEISVLGTRSLL